VPFLTPDHPVSSSLTEALFRSRHVAAGARPLGPGSRGDVEDRPHILLPAVGKGLASLDQAACRRLFRGFTSPQVDSLVWFGASHRTVYGIRILSAMKVRL